MSITALEREVLQGIMDSDFQDGEKGAGRYVWSWSANPWDGDKTRSRQFAGLVTSLMKKGFVNQSGEGRDACVCITEAGLDALNGK